MSTASPASIPPATDAVIQVRGLTKRYGDTDVVRQLDLDVRRGETLALVGPNGAGKTTLLEILGGFRRADGGTARVLGSDPARAGRTLRERVGIVLQESRPEAGLTVRECLELYAGYYAAPRPVGATLELVGLEDSGDVFAEQLSGGRQRRLDVALALIGNPEVLLLDEPTTGFDPAARHAAWSAIDQLRALGTTILLTTHSMQEAERLAGRIAVLARGTIVADGPPGSVGGRDALASTIRFTLPSGEVTLRSEHPLADLQTLAAWALPRGLDLPDLEVRRPTLEDAYLSLTREAS
jgi:ABC-2 type transport system ATP-binding protein